MLLWALPLVFYWVPPSARVSLSLLSSICIARRTYTLQLGCTRVEPGLLELYLDQSVDVLL